MKTGPHRLIPLRPAALASAIALAAVAGQAGFAQSEPTDTGGTDSGRILDENEETGLGEVIPGDDFPAPQDDAAGERQEGVDPFADSFGTQDAADPFAEPSGEQQQMPEPFPGDEGTTGASPFPAPAEEGELPEHGGE